MRVQQMSNDVMRGDTWTTRLRQDSQEAGGCRQRFNNIEEVRRSATLACHSVRMVIRGPARCASLHERTANSVTCSVLALGGSGIRPRGLCAASDSDGAPAPLTGRRRKVFVPRGASRVPPVRGPGVCRRSSLRHRDISGVIAEQEHRLRFLERGGAKQSRHRTGPLASHGAGPTAPAP